MIAAQGPSDTRRNPEVRLVVHEQEWLGGALKRSIDAYVVTHVARDPEVQFEIRWFMHQSPLDVHTYPGPLNSDDQLAMYTYLLDRGHTEQSAAACLVAHKATPLQRYLLPRTLYRDLDVSDASLAWWAWSAAQDEQEQQQPFVVTLDVMRVMKERLDAEVDQRAGRLVRALGGMFPASQ